MLIDWSESQNGMGVVASDPLNATEKELIQMASEVGLHLERKISEGKTKHGGTILAFMKT